MHTLPPLPTIIIEQIVRRALEEDFGNGGDVTANLLVPASARAKLFFRARQKGVIAGLSLIHI